MDMKDHWKWVPAKPHNSLTSLTSMMHQLTQMATNNYIQCKIHAQPCSMLSAKLCGLWGGLVSILSFFVRHVQLQLDQNILT